LKEYEEHLEYKATYINRVLELAEKWKVKINMNREFTDREIILSRCSEDPPFGSTIFTNYKKRKFFEALNKSYHEMRKRLEVIKECLIVLDRWHKDL